MHRRHKFHQEWGPRFSRTTTVQFDSDWNQYHRKCRNSWSGQPWSGQPWSGQPRSAPRSSRRRCCSWPACWRRRWSGSTARSLSSTTLNPSCRRSHCKSQGSTTQHHGRQHDVRVGAHGTSVHPFSELAAASLPSTTPQTDIAVARAWHRLPTPIITTWSKREMIPLACRWGPARCSAPCTTRGWRPPGNTG